VAKQYTLGKTERLKSRKIIDQLFKEGKSYAFAPFRVYYLFTSTPDTLLQSGVGVSTKNFKKAVDRNRIKRVTREAWRLQKNPLQQVLEEQNKKLSVFLIYTGKELPVYKEVYEKTGKIVDRLCKMLMEKK
jgi:ribonuclease P protein component